MKYLNLRLETTTLDISVNIDKEELDMTKNNEEVKSESISM